LGKRKLQAKHILFYIKESSPQVIKMKTILRIALKSIIIKLYLSSFNDSFKKKLSSSI